MMRAPTVSAFLILLSISTANARLGELGQIDIRKFAEGVDQQGASNRFPYVVSLRDPGPSKAHVCGGALVGPSVVLTSAECIDPAAGGIANPEVRLSVQCETGDCQTYRFAKTSWTYLHPEWTGNPKDGFDIGLVILDEYLPGPYLRVPKFPIRSNQMWDLLPLKDQKVHLPGFFSRQGEIDEILKAFALPFRHKMFCDRMYSEYPTLAIPHDSFVCAGGFDNRVCSTDNGSPLIIKGRTAGDDFAIGVLSGASIDSCWVDVEVPTLFTTFTNFREGLNLIKQGSNIVLPMEEMPEESVEETMPEQSVEETMPEQAVEETMPEQAVEETMPEQSVEETMPEQSVEETMPEQAVEETMPEQAVEETMPETMPEQAVEETMPEQAVEETMPEQAVEETMPAEAMPMLEEACESSSIEIVGSGFCNNDQGVHASHQRFVEPTLESCLQRCRDAELCYGATYNPASSFCFIPNFEVVSSGQSSFNQICWAKGPEGLEVVDLTSICQPLDDIGNEFVFTSSGADSCRAACLDDPSCTAASYLADSKHCLLYKGEIAEPVSAETTRTMCWRREDVPCAK